ncbi:MAG: methionyl-tRNA formyltransferase [Candidatus Saccharimonadales bacterium]
MTKSSRIIFFGNERLSTGFTPQGAPTLQALIAEGYNVIAVVANYEVGTSRKARTLEIEAVAKKHNIPVLLPAKLSDIHDELANYNPTVGVLVAYGKIIPQSIIDLFPRGILNIHPSLLPAYRGSTPIEQAILDGAQKTGVSIMKIVRAMDAGPIYAQEKLALHDDESKYELTERLLALGGKLLLECLPNVLDGSAKSVAQNEADATYTSQISKADGIIDWQKPAVQLEREIRAYYGWPKSRTTLFGHDVIVTKARIASSEADGTLVKPCTPGYLEILELVAPSGRTMTGADFVRGYQKTAR